MFSAFQTDTKLIPKRMEINERVGKNVFHLQRHHGRTKGFTWGVVFIMLKAFSKLVLSLMDICYTIGLQLIRCLLMHLKPDVFKCFTPLANTLKAF